MKKQSTIIAEHGQVSALIAIGFYAIAGMCLLSGWGILMAFPEIISGDPYRLETLSLGVLTIVGFAASFIFGTYYAVASLLSGSGLWNRPLGLVHLVLHTLGIGWLGVSLAASAVVENTHIGLVVGGLLILLGVICLVFNLTVTASRFNRWEPAQLTVLLSLFWLGICAVLGFALVIDQFHPVTGLDPLRLIESHVVLGLAGFLWLGLIGASLKLLSMFAISKYQPGACSWVGCVVSNLVLLAMVPVLLFHPQVPFAYLAAGLLVGSLFYVFDILRLVVTAKNGRDAAIGGTTIALLVGIVLLAWMAVGMPISAVATDFVREQARIGITIITLGIMPLIALSLSMRIIPFLVWRVRCAPYVGKYAVLSASELTDRRAMMSAVLCLALGSAYIIFGQWFSQPAGAQIGSIALFVGAFWCIHTFLPAIMAFLLGVDKPAKT